MRVPLIITVLVAALAVPAAAEEDNVKQARTELALKEKAQEVKAKCGVAPKVTVNWKSFPKDFGNFSVSGYCESVLDALRQHCEGKAKKAYIQKRLKSLKCEHGEKDKRKLTARKGAITFSIDFAASNYGDWARKELLRSF